MAEKKRSRRKKDEYTGPGEQEVEKPSKEEYDVAKWMRKNLRTKKTKFLNHVVEYFSSNKAIDALLQSKFGEAGSALFTTREQVVEYLDIMLEHKFFHRAKKVPINIDDIRCCSKDSSAATSSATPKPTKKEEKTKKEKESATIATATEAEKEKATAEGEGEKGETAGTTAGGGGGVDVATKEKKEKRKRKIRLDMHPEQVFVDGSEAYVWIYDPIPIHYWIYGLILLLGAIGICLFPLWPPILRKGVYYLSIAAAGFLVFILALTVLRLIIFTIVWALTAGKLNLWIFPNLTEDVGFFASFWPLYESKYISEKSSKSTEKRSKSKSKKQKEKDSDAEEEKEGTEESASSPLIPLKIEEIKEHDLAVDEEHKVACTTKDDDSSHSSGGYNTDEPNENENESSENKYSDDSDLSGYCILEAGDSPSAEVLERKPQKTKKDD